MDDIPMWKCPSCEDLNAIGLEVCRCGERRPSAYSIRFIPENTPLAQELEDRIGKAGKRAKKGANKAKSKPAKKTPKPRQPSSLEIQFMNLWMASKYADPTPEFRFHPTRRWRFDFAWPHDKIAVELEGGTWNGGRHTRGKGYEQDTEKYNEAVILGWRVLRFTKVDSKTIEKVETLFRQSEKKEKAA